MPSMADEAAVAVAKAMEKNLLEAASRIVRTISVARAMAAGPEAADKMEEGIRTMLEQMVQSVLKEDEALITGKLAVLKAKRTAARQAD